MRVIVRTKASWAGLLTCRTHQHYHRQWLPVVRFQISVWKTFIHV